MSLPQISPLRRTLSYRPMFADHPSHLSLWQLGHRNDNTGETDEQWSGDYIFENEWQSFRTKKDRTLELTSTAHECTPGPRKIAVKVVDIFGNDTMKILEVNV